MKMESEIIKNKIEQGLPGARVSVTGDGVHFEATIVAADFSGKSMVQRHQLVYAALGDLMQSAIHALSMRTLSPNEVQQKPEN